VVEALEGRTLMAGPQVVSVEFDGPTPVYTPKSRLVIRFNSNVQQSFGPTDVVLRHLDEGYDITHNSGFGNNFSVSYTLASNTAVVTFPGLTAEQLTDGNYQLRLLAAGITDLAGQRLDGNKDSVPGDDFTSVFYRLTGDTQVAFNGTPLPDRRVDFIDYQVLSKNFGRLNATPRQGDLNYDGKVDSLDMDIFMGQPFDPLFPGVFGNTLPDPTVTAPAVAAQAAPQPAPVTAAPVMAKPVKKPAPAAKAVSKPAPLVAPPRFAAKRIARDSASWLAGA
jgi:hypothetical protein